MRNLFILLTSLLCSITLCAKNIYIFSYFVGNGEDGLHLAYSYDGLKWEKHLYVFLFRGKWGRWFTSCLQL